MTGVLLEPDHGYPLRLCVPGWYGVASVKWLRRIEVLDHAFKGYFQTTKYTIQRRNGGGIETAVVGPISIKSEIIRPKSGATIGVGATRIFGVAWAGEEAIDRVEISADSGRSWSNAELLGMRARYSWTLWEYIWEASEPGPCTLLARAVSTSGGVQPAEHDPLHGGYQIHFSRPIHVVVAGTQRGYDKPADADTLLYDMNSYAEENSRLPLDVEMEFTGGEGI